MIVRRGLPDGLRPDAARLYWEAFGAKLGPVLGPEPRALHFFERVIRADHCIVALDDLGRLIGLAGFKTPEGSFAGGTRRDLRRTYGIVGAGWRGLLLWALSRDIDNARFLLDGICVTAAARGQGVGSALIDRICDEGLRLGYRSVRLDVVDTNGRARALYERLGFVAVRTEKIGPLRHVFGFSAATTMVRPIG
ncbi:MAG: GNAT family N-acetyltransferase, partial [Pseudomonadota bacterium]